MRITEAAGRLGMTPADAPVPGVSGPASGTAAGRPPGGQRTGYGRQPGPASSPLPGWRGPGRQHRQFSDADLAAVALGLSIERRYDISPVALAFGIRVLADPRVRADVAELGRRIGRIQPPPARALDFEQERALRLLSQPVTAASTSGPGGNRPRA